MRLLGFIGATLLAMQAFAAVEGDPSFANVVWDSPSKNDSGSMPLGNGRFAANVWVDNKGELELLLAHEQAFDETAAFLKIGRIRIATTPALWTRGAKFKQTLDLLNGRILIETDVAKITLSCEMSETALDVIKVDVASTDSAKKFDVRVWNNGWRTAPQVIKEPVLERAVTRGFMTEHLRPADVVLPGTTVGDEGSIAWCHENGENTIYTRTMTAQHLESLISKYPDPMRNRVFGAAVYAKGMMAKDGNTLVTSEPTAGVQIRVASKVGAYGTAAKWQEAINAAYTDYLKVASSDEANASWWQKFWARSWVRATGTPEAELVSKAYVYQRYMTACAARGELPVHFNGSLFTMTSAYGAKNPDFRKWGGGFWFQNCRLIYYPLLASGDFDLMNSFFSLYLTNMELLKDRAKVQFGFDNCLYITETSTFWAVAEGCDFGWNNPKNIPVNAYIARLWEGGLELSFMMLERYRYTGDAEFARKTAIPFADAVVRFYFTNFKVNAEGKLVLTPAQSLETYQKGVTDPTPDVAGLATVLDGLLAIEEREEWKTWRAQVPAIPTRTTKNGEVIAPARIYGGRGNVENPELYTIFPYRTYTWYKPDAELALRTFNARANKSTGCWYQSPIQAALLKLNDAVAKDLVFLANHTEKGCRFPAIWQRSHDWFPDMDNGGVLASTFQYAALQADDGEVRPFPAWPKTWNGDFKLHAPGGKVIYGTIQAGGEPTVREEKR